MRAHKKIVLQKGNTELSELLFTLRSTPKSRKIILAELQIGRKMSTVRDIITTKSQPNCNVSENDDNLER